LETAIFWFSGILFFVVQAWILLRLLKARRVHDPARSAAIHAEIVWTLVPAALVAAIALMAGDRMQSPGPTELRPVVAETRAPGAP
jgi:heme/copper-type cytochrome/quinol oxidase subunit 2